MYASEVRARFLEVTQVLIESGIVKSEPEIEKSLGKQPRWLFRLRYGNQVITRSDIIQLVEVYKANPIYIYQGDGRPLLTLYLRKIDGVNIKGQNEVIAAQMRRYPMLPSLSKMNSMQ